MWSWSTRARSRIYILLEMLRMKFISTTKKSKQHLIWWLLTVIFRFLYLCSFNGLTLLVINTENLKTGCLLLDASNIQRLTSFVYLDTFHKISLKLFLCLFPLMAPLVTEPLGVYLPLDTIFSFFPFFIIFSIFFGDKPTGCLPLDTNGSWGNKKGHKNRWLAATAHALVQLKIQIQLQIQIKILILAPDDIRY